MPATNHMARSRTIRDLIGGPAGGQSYTGLLLIVLSIVVVGLVGCKEPSTRTANSDVESQELKSPGASTIVEQKADQVNDRADKGKAAKAKPSIETNDEVQDWQQFRGPDSRSEVETVYPLQWDSEKGVLWKQGLPGRGASSPIVSGDRIFLTAYDGYGLTVEDVENSKKLRHHLLCLDRETGHPLWQREITGTSLKQKMNPELARHGFASATAATDGKSVFASFGVTGVFAFDMDGNALWQRNVGLNTHYFGSSASLTLFKNLVIVNASIESKTIYALDKKTGKAVWKIPNVIECWSMPVIGTSKSGRTEMIVSSKNQVNAYDPKTGAKLWTCDGVQDYVVSVPIIVDGICYLTGGKQKQTMAIRLGEVKEVDNRKIWAIRKYGSNVSSPVFKDGRLFIFHDSGNIQILDAATGDLIDRHRTATRTRPFASPLLAGEHLYMPFQDAGVSVFKSDAGGEEVSVKNSDDGVSLMASIVPCKDRLLIRSDKNLTCVSAKARKVAVAKWNKPDDYKIIKTIESVNINPEKGWTRRYMQYLTPNFDETTKQLLIPYKSVITEEQTEEAIQIISGVKPKYDALRDQFEALQWEELSAPANKIEQFRDRWQSLEKETNQLNRTTRVLVKKLFPAEQLQQHFDDAKAGISHLPPSKDSKKDGEK